MMKNNILISVIVPVYNVAEYLPRCVDSILRQTYKELEIWLIDDGSTDQSGVICDQYAEIDPRIRVIHKENGGLSDARNAAIDKIKGKYVTFIDSDDYIADCFVERLYSEIVKYNAEIAIAGFLPTINDTEGYFLNDEIEIYSSKESIKELLYQKKYNTSAWAKLYESSLFDNVRYPKGKLFEDICTTYKLLDKATKVVFDYSKLYFYFQRGNSIVRSGFNVKKMDYVSNTKELHDFIYEKYPDLKSAADFRYLWANIHVWVNITDKKKYIDIYQIVEENIKKYRWSALKDTDVALKNKIAVFLSLFGWRVTRAVYQFSKI